MIQHTNDDSINAKQDAVVTNPNSQNDSHNSSTLPTGKPTTVWQSPEFEEFDLCMEVTAYVHHWD